MVDSANERFWAKVTPGTGDCWVWTGAKQPNGYGRFGFNGKAVFAHRWIYEQMIADIPTGLVIDHLCCNRACVNPWHLEPVPQAVNVRRGRSVETLRAMRAAITHCLRDHEYTPENTRTDKRGRRSCKACHRVTDREKKRRLRATQRAGV